MIVKKPKNTIQSDSMHFIKRDFSVYLMNIIGRNFGDNM
jgi:hypothetical protein